MLDPRIWSPARLSDQEQPRLVVAVDTEAEFEWRPNASRAATGVRSVKAQAAAQLLFARYGVRPTYLLDYPVSSTPESVAFIRDLHAAGACEIGAHLQPWDTPPVREALTESNSYPGNLPPELEREKLVTLTETIAANIGVRPRIYKAGRYGVGRATPATLEALGYEIDMSVLPRTDLSPAFGPDFSHCEARPYWFGQLLEIPLTVGFVGLLAGLGDRFGAMVTRDGMKRLRVPGLLAALRLLDRVQITPEGVPFEEQRRLTRAMLRSGYRVFSLTYHSPSLAPGNTPYVRTAAELAAFLERIEQYLDFFMTEAGGRAATPFEVRELALRHGAPAAPLQPARR